MEVREKVREFLNAPKSQNIVFTSNCTEALNLAILGSVKKGGNVVTTINDHNSVLRPLHYLKNKGEITLNIAQPERDDILTKDDILKYIEPDTYLVCVNHVSNVDGMVADISAIGQLCEKRNIIFLVDGAQSCGHIQIDMQKSNIDMLAIAPHKGLYAAQGVGVLAFSDKIKLKPIKYGGTGTESFSPVQPENSPECYESGTIPTPNILGLGAGVDFVRNNFNNIILKIEDLTTFINFELRKIDNVIVYTHPKNSHGVIGFNILGMESECVGQILNDKFGICVRSGLHCAPLKHTFLNTLKSGIVRVSVSYFNTFSEVIALIKAIKKIANENYG